MTKNEFLRAFGEKLSERLPADEVLRQMQFYEGYLDAETRRGRSEEAVVAELGDPILLARNVLESPRARADFWNVQSPYEQGFAEGSYESRMEARMSPKEERREQPVDRNFKTRELKEDEAEKPLNKPDGIWRKAAEPAELKKRGSWERMPDPKEEPEVMKGKVDRSMRPVGLSILLPIIMTAVLVIAVIAGVATGAIATKSLLVPLIVFAAAIALVFVLVLIRKKK